MPKTGLNKIKKIIEGKTVAVATINYDDGNPHAIAAEINSIEDDKIIITDNHMNKTIKNIKKNPNVSMSFWGKLGGWRIDGIADYQTSGKWLEFVKNLKTNKEYSPKGALVINVNDVVELA